MKEPWYKKPYPWIVIIIAVGLAVALAAIILLSNPVVDKNGKVIDSLTRGNWTALIGAMIGFLGSATLALVSYHQSTKIRQSSEQEAQLRIVENRQPSFLLKPKIPFRPSDPAAFEMTIRIYGEKPIFSVYFFGVKCFDVLEPGKENKAVFSPRQEGEKAHFTYSTSDLISPTHQIPKKLHVAYLDSSGLINAVLFSLSVDEHGGAFLAGKRYEFGYITDHIDNDLLLKSLFNVDSKIDLMEIIRTQTDRQLD